jgi:hypothetical protein
MLCFPDPQPFRHIIQGDSNMTGTNCDLFTHKSSRSYLNHLVKSPLGLNLFYCRLTPQKMQWQGCVLNDRRTRVHFQTGIRHFFTVVGRLWSLHSLLFRRYEELFGDKMAGAWRWRKTHSYRVEVKLAGSYTFILSYFFLTWCSNKYSGKFMYLKLDKILQTGYKW